MRIPNFRIFISKIKFIKVITMKRFFLIMLLLCLFWCATCAQEPSINKRIKYYDVWIYQQQEDSVIKGFLYALKDTSIIVLSDVQNVKNKIEPDKLIEIPINKITVIITRITKSKRTAIIIGFIGGFSIGILSSVLIYESVTNSDPMVYVSPAIYVIPILISSAAVGGGIGVLGGSAKMSYKINGSRTNYLLNAKSMRSKSIKYQLDN